MAPTIIDQTIIVQTRAIPIISILITRVRSANWLTVAIVRAPPPAG